MKTPAVAALLVGFLLTGCVSNSPARRSDDFREELSRQIEAMLRERDRLRAERDRREPSSSVEDAPRYEQQDAPPRAMASVVIPVAGVHHAQLRDTFGEARSGGRGHEGIDIFAARGTEVLAAAGGVIEFIAEKPRPGRCVWIAGSDGHSYFYAHLDRWAPGLYDGMLVRAGDLLGFVGNSGNASGGSPHLHFEVRRDGQALNPYPILRRAAVATNHAGSESILAGK